MTTKTPNEIQTLINNVSTTFNGKVPWSDTGALKDILTYINEEPANYGVLNLIVKSQLPNNDDLSYPSLASIKGDGLYKWNAINSNWLKILSYPYETVIGGSSTLSYVVTHFMGIKYPNITLYNVTNPTPTLILNQSALFSSITADDEDNLIFTFTASPAAILIKVVIQ